MTLFEFKHGRAWDILAKAFEMKALTLERMIWGFIPVSSKILSDLHINTVVHAYSMLCLEDGNERFKNFPMAIEAIDVTFQESNRPSGNISSEFHVPSSFMRSENKLLNKPILLWNIICLSPSHLNIRKPTLVTSRSKLLSYPAL